MTETKTDACVQQVETVAEYIEAVEKELKAIGHLLGRDIVLYRGQRCGKTWTLVPSIERLLKKRRDPAKKFTDLEKEIFDDFRKRSLPFLESVPQTDLDWLTLAQHHGLPTRLLDWSCNVLAALWFTVSEDKPCPGDGQANEDGAVWIFRTEPCDWMRPEEEEGINRNNMIFKPEKLLVYMPKTVTSRVAAQLGFLTIHPDVHGEFQPLEKHPDYRHKLRKIGIPRKSFKDFREALDRMGINRFSIFPGLDGLARHVQWYHFRGDDE